MSVAGLDVVFLNHIHHEEDEFSAATKATIFHQNSGLGIGGQGFLVAIGLGQATFSLMECVMFGLTSERIVALAVSIEIGKN